MEVLINIQIGFMICIGIFTIVVAMGIQGSEDSYSVFQGKARKILRIVLPILALTFLLGLPFAKVFYNNSLEFWCQYDIDCKDKKR